MARGVGARRLANFEGTARNLALPIQQNHYSTQTLAGFSKVDIQKLDYALGVNLIDETTGKFRWMLDYDPIP